MKNVRPSRFDNQERAEMDKALDENPPQIVWRKNRHGVMIPVIVDDPHTDHPNKPKRGDA
jgi:hypothetical protein